MKLPKRFQLQPGEDREITRADVRKLTGLTSARLSQLKRDGLLEPLRRSENPRRGKRGNLSTHLYSLRIVLEYLTEHPTNTTYQTNARRTRQSKESNEHEQQQQRAA
jgi:hypothetical protein